MSDENEELEPICDECGGEGRVEVMYGGRMNDDHWKIVPCPSCQDEYAPDELPDNDRLPSMDDTGLPESPL